MKKLCPAVLCVFLMFLETASYADSSAEEMLKAIVRIKATIPKEAFTAKTLGTEREGHGVLIDNAGYILTIGYIVTEAEKIEVTGPDDKTVDGTFVGYDQRTGFGLVQVGKSLGVAPMKLGESSTVKEGDPLLVAGSGGSDTVIATRVVSRKEFAGYWEYLLEEPIITAPAYSSFGGAALIDPKGELVGIGSLYTEMAIPGLGALSCNLFVPIDLLKPILNDLKARGRSREPPRPWLGINAQETHGRVFITQVTSGGPAEKGELKVDDLILRVGGKPVAGLADFYRKLWGLGISGVDVPLTILRGVEIQEMKIRSGDRYQFLVTKIKKT